MRRRLWQLLALIALLILMGSAGGCRGTYLRSNAADCADRRVARTQDRADAALDVIAPEVECEDGTIKRVVIDPSEMDVEDVAGVLDSAARALGEISDDMAVTGAWLEAMKDDFGRVKPEKQVELGSEAERTLGVQYSGWAGSKAWIGMFFRGAWDTVTGIWSTVKWTWRALKWGLGAAAMIFAWVGFWQWLGKRRERAGRRELSDAVDDLKKNGDKEKVLAALEGKRCARERYEADRRWRAKHARATTAEAKE